MAKATGKHRRDNFYRIAKAEGYRSRAAIKLLQLDTCWSFLSTARAVLDLGAAPGGWLQVAVRGATPGAFVVGVDLARIRPIRGAISLTEDITSTASCSAAVRRLMDSKGVTAFDVVLHDGVGQKKKRKRDGARAQEASSQSALLIDAVRLATMFLAPKGSFITKFTEIQDFNAIRFCLQQLFEKVRVAKPMASRSTSAEVYFICFEYKAPTKVQPELFDLNHLFTASLEKNKPTDEVRNPMETRPRGRAKYTGPIWKAGSASDFIWSEAQTPQEILGSFMGVSFDDPASLPIKNHELTTAEVAEYETSVWIWICWIKKTLNYVWEWRTRIRHALSSCSQVIPKPDVTAVDAKVDSAELDMKDSIGDGGKEETQTHEEMVSDEEHHRYEGMLDEAHERFVIKDHKVKQQLKRVNPINPYANADLVEKSKKRVRVRNYKEKALVLVDPLMKDKNTSGSEKKVGKEDAKRRRGKRAPQQARKRCKLAGADADHLDMTPVLST